MQNSTDPFDVINDRLIALAAKFDALVPAEIINRAELCKRLDITEPTVIRWEKKKKIPSFRLGSCVRYNWPNVIKALEGKNQFN